MAPILFQFYFPKILILSLLIPEHWTKRDDLFITFPTVVGQLRPNHDFHWLIVTGSVHHSNLLLAGKRICGVNYFITVNLYLGLFKWRFQIWIKSKIERISITIQKVDTSSIIEAGWLFTSFQYSLIIFDIFKWF